MLPRVFDRDLVRRHLERRPASFADFITELAKDDLAERLLAVSRSFSRALIMAPDGRPLPIRGRSREGIFTFERAATVLPSPGAVLVDPEQLSLPHHDYDLIVSLLDLQVVNDVPGFLAQLRAHLRPDGLFLAAAIGGDTLTELREAMLSTEVRLTGGATARIAPFIPLADAGALLQRAGFAMPVADVENHVVRYDNAITLMHDLKALGASNPLAERPGRPMTRTLIGETAAEYGEHHADPDGRVRATLEILWMSGWAPHEDQQKPLKPGSGKISLAQVLGDKSQQN
jgi:SAM-dependent methyltransferase